MEVSGGAVLVVEGASAWTSGQCAERPLIERVVETFVADVAGQHGTLSARRDGQWGGSGVVLATLGSAVPVRVVPELTEHPGAEHNTKSWQGAVDVGVRVFLKMVGQNCLEFLDLTVQCRDDMNRCSRGGSERGSHRRGRGEV